MLLFKYLSPGSAERVLESDERVSLKFSLPRNFNDPYELFLQPDSELADEGLLAFYEHLIGDVPQLPVACFSCRPDSLTMWAHYSSEQQGVCLAFDEDAFADCFPVAYVENVSYSEEAATIDSGLLEFAFTTAKRRHSINLLGIAFKAAYFMKRLEWQYECERRAIVAPNDVTDVGGHLIAKIDTKCVRAILVGAKISDSLRAMCQQRAISWKVPIYEFRNGRRSYQPFFSDSSSNTVFLWSSGAFEEATVVCSKCGEPGPNVEDDLCIWCRMGPDAKQMAATRSMLSLTVALGMEPLPVSFAGIAPKGRDVKKS